VYDIPEADWRVFRRAHAAALGRFSTRVLTEVECLMHDDTRSAHQRYRAIYDLLRVRDREMASLFDSPKRKVAVRMLAQLRGEGLLADEDFASLSSTTQDAVQLRLEDMPG
jgi:hypothetical protein